MCLAAVCQVVSVPLDGVVQVRSGGRELPVSLLTLDGQVAVGDWLLVHCGFALSRLTEGDARAALALRDMEVSP